MQLIDNKNRVEHRKYRIILQSKEMNEQIWKRWNDEKISYMIR